MKIKIDEMHPVALGFVVLVLAIIIFNVGKYIYEIVAPSPFERGLDEATEKIDRLFEKRQAEQQSP